MRLSSLFISFLLVLVTGYVMAQMPDKYTLSADSTVNRLAGTKKVYFATRISDRPKIDGKLNDACWESGVWAGGFAQQTPNQGKQPSQETEIKILYDNNNLYVGFKCHDKEGKIRPILSRRDEIAGDIAGIAFDSYHDKQTAYEFNVAASGQKVDLVHLGAYNWDTNWDAVWYGKAKVLDTIWTSELQIPFSQIHFAPGKEQIWGMHVWRWIDRLNEEDQWKLIPIDAPAMVYLFGELRGIEGIKPKVNYEFLPYVNSRISSDTNLKDKVKYGAGLSGKIGLNSGFMLDYAFNPDFGQVESDPSVLNLTSYEVFNEEKRPFFLEGNTVFDFNVNDDMLFYSRRIGHEPSFIPFMDEGQTISMASNAPILAALKLTGKTKKGLSLGIVDGLTGKENASIYGTDDKSKIAVEPLTNYFAGRAKQDFNKGNTVLGGMIASTNRSINDEHLKFLSTSSFVGGLDFQHNWKNRKYFVDFKGFFSHIEGSEQAISELQLSPVHYYQRESADYLDYNSSLTSLSGWGGILKGGKRSGKFRINGSLNWRSPGLDLNDVGYLRQADIFEELVNVKYVVNEPKGIIRSYFVEFEQERDWTYGMENTLDRLKLHGYLLFKNLWSVHLNLKRYYNIFDTRELRGGPNLRKDDYNDAELYVQTNSVKKFWFGFGPRFKFFSDQTSKTSLFNLFFKWQINNRFNISSRTVYDHSINFNQYVSRINRGMGEPIKYIVGTIDRHTLSSTIRFEYYLSPEISVQYYGNPYTSAGSYTNYRRVADASARQIDKRYVGLGDNIPENVYNPNFNYKEFHSNLVARWEFRPGSTLYLVWTNVQTSFSKQPESVWKSFGKLSGDMSENVFMLKFSYWFSL